MCPLFRGISVVSFCMSFSRGAVGSKGSYSYRELPSILKHILQVASRHALSSCIVTIRDIAMSSSLLGSVAEPSVRIN